MQLNKFTDFGLRLLMYLIQPNDQLYTISQAAKDLEISENHLVKVTHFMVKQGWIVSSRGKGGGIRLADNAMCLPIGDIVRILEHDKKIIDCDEPMCTLRSYCNLKSALDQALEQFYQYLNQYKLQDAIKKPYILPSNRNNLANVIHITKID